MMKDKCFSCKFRSDPEVGGCSFSPDKENPIRGNSTDDCAFIKMEGHSKWQERFNPYGKIYYPTCDQPHYVPGAGPIGSEPSEDDRFSLVSWQSLDKLGSVSFLVDKEGRAYNCETKEFVGELSNFQPQKPTEKQLQQGVRWLKEKFQIK